MSSDLFKWDSGKNNLGQGTSFPASPSSGDRFFRTDLGWDCYYDGTRWLTMHEYSVHGDLEASVLSWVITCAMRTDYKFYVTRCAIAVNVASQDASNYWGVQVRGNNTSYSGDQLLLVSTVDDVFSPSYAQVMHDSAPTKNIPSSGYDNNLAILVAPTGSPGVIYCVATLYWRLIVT